MEKKGKKTAKESTIPIKPEQLEEEIRIRAREIYLARGDSLADWLQAEKEIKKKYKIS